MKRIFLIGIYISFLFNSLFGSDDFLLGWYSDSDAEYLKVLVGIKDNKYGYIDPYSKYYNLFLNYSVFNTYTLPDSIDIMKTTPFLQLPDSLVFGKYFIADLPRYSSLFRLLFAFPPGEKNQDTTTFSIEVFDSLHNFIGNLKCDGIFTGRNSKYPVYSYFSFIDTRRLNDYVVFDLNEKYILLDKNSPYVYSHGDIFGFSYRLLNNKGWFVAEIKIDSEKGPLTLRIFSSSDAANKVPLKRNGHDMELFLDSGISSSGSEKSFVFEEMFENNILISHPAFLSIEDSVYKPFEINILKLTESSGIRIDSVLDFVFYIKDAEIADASVSFSNEFSLNVLKKTVDRIMSYKKASLLGFYTADEIERSEVFFHDRWMKRYHTEIYSDIRFPKKEKNTLRYLQKSIRDYIKSKNKVPFSLSTVHFYTEKKSTFSDYNADFTLFADSFLFYDDYSYTTSFITNFMKASSLADSLNLKILYVGDAYASSGKNSVGFEKMKWRFFSPIVMGADGMLFYSYFSLKTISRKKLLEDVNKVNVGAFAEILAESGLRNSLNDSKQFENKTDQSFSRISSVSIDARGDIFLMYIIKRTDLPMNENISSRQIKFNRSDTDLVQIKSMMDKNDYFMTDITPYIRRNGQAEEIASSGNLVSSAYSFNVDSSDFMIFLNSIPFCEIKSDFDVKIIKFTLKKNIAVRANLNQFDLTLSIRNAVYLKDGRFAVCYKDSLNKAFRLVESFIVDSSLILYNPEILLSNRPPAKETPVFIKFVDLSGNKRKLDVNIID